MSETESMLLTTKQLANKLGISVATIERWRSNNEPNQPPYIRLGGCAIRYRLNDVEDWMEINTIKTEVKS